MHTEACPHMRAHTRAHAHTARQHSCAHTGSSAHVRTSTPTNMGTTHIHVRMQTQGGRARIQRDEWPQHTHTHVHTNARSARNTRLDGTEDAECAAGALAHLRPEADGVGDGFHGVGVAADEEAAEEDALDVVADGVEVG